MFFRAYLLHFKTMAPRLLNLKFNRIYKYPNAEPEFPFLLRCSEEGDRSDRSVSGARNAWWFAYRQDGIPQRQQASTVLTHSR